MPFGGLGIWEIFFILVILLLVFGPRRLPELGGALGKGIREFKRSVSDIRSELNVTEPDQKEIPPQTTAQAAAQAAAQAEAKAEAAEKQQS